MKYIDINEETLNKLTKKKFGIETYESTVHPFIENNKKKVFKLFKQGIDINNKVKKIILLNDRLKKIDFVVPAESIVKYNEKTIGYIMPYIDGEIFEPLNFSRKDNILILKDIATKLKELHKLGIVCGDIIGNIMIDSNKNVYFIDYDNFSIDNLNIDSKNIFLKEYLKQIEKFDYKFDNYLLNLLTLRILTKIYTKYLKFEYSINNRKFNFRDNKINEIVENTFNLNESYNGNLIIDEIKTNEDLKKIKTRFF